MATTFFEVKAVYKKFPDCKQEDVQKLGEWAKLQPHFPSLTEFQLSLFLHRCYYSNEAAKTYMDNFFTMRTLCPEFFTNRDARNDEIQKQSKVGMVVLLPHLTAEGYRVVYGNAIDHNPSHYVFNSLIKMQDMLISLTEHTEGPCEGYIIIIDCKGGQLGHLTCFGLPTTKKFLYYLQEAIPIRLIQIHIINVVPVVDIFLSMARPFLNKDLTQKLFFHKSMETVYKQFPKNCFPNNVGGTGGSLQELYGNTMAKLVENVEYFLDEENFKADESKRIDQTRNAGQLFGTEGTFKKLDID